MTQIKIYVVDYPLYSMILDTFKISLCKIFSGLTEYQNVKGYWLDSHNKLITDNVTIWEIYTYANTLKDSIRFSEIMQNIKAVTVQQAQYYTIDNIPHLV